MKKRMLATAALALLTLAGAQAANKWNLKNEEIATFTGKVVDVLCELSGNCPADCGAGQRQLGVLRDDGMLILAAKGNTFFAGATVELQPYCGQMVEVDGLLIRNPHMNVYFVQQLRPQGQSEWINANQFEKNWAQAHPGLTPPWFVNDPTVQKVLAEDGILGIPGLDPSK